MYNWEEHERVKGLHTAEQVGRHCLAHHPSAHMLTCVHNACKLLLIGSEPPHNAPVQEGRLFLCLFLILLPRNSSALCANRTCPRRLFLVGSGTVSDPGLVASVSRSGDRGELLRGPLYYCVVLILAALTCWRENPAGLMVISLMWVGPDAFLVQLTPM